ncbi:sialidase-3-like [Micropterus dolomieu]|uniref:sialidase-3-like n=1 Tax=Micropterus dolomieu TaxID=147949 RepID=UPI001E8DA0DB|nr:sialidase-3-like [Micropterus dolomieu]
MVNKQSSHCDLKTDKKTLFKSKVYRIPALLYERQSETLLAFAEQRKTSDDSGTEMLVMKTGKLKKEESSDVRTIEWSELKLVKEAHIDGYRPMNPCPVYEKTSKILFLFFICVEDAITEQYQIEHSDNRTRLCYIKSQDLGQNWSEVTDLTDELDEIKKWATFAVGPGHGIQTESGRLIVPTYAYIKSKKYASYSLSLYRDESDKKWKFGKMLKDESLECEIAEVSDDTGLSYIYCNARVKGSYRLEALSNYDGDSFINLPCAKKLVETGTGCQGSVVSFPAQSEAAHADGNPNQNPNKYLLFTHPSHKAKRVKLGVYLNKSPKNPNAWSKPWIINSGPSGYSDLAYIGDGLFACLMECGEQKETEQIAAVVFSYNEVKQGIGE